MPDTSSSNTASTTIALAAGGTGGHVFPAEALARELMARGHRVVFYTDRRGAQYSQALQDIDHLVLPARSLAGGLLGKAAAALVIARAIWRARADMRRRGVALVVGFGGYPSFAPALAARTLGLPLLLHEQTTRVSVANARLLRFANALAVSFPDIAGLGGFDRDRVHMTGNPVRASILAARGPYPAIAADAPLRLLVVGGSQSASVFGRVVPNALQRLPEALRRRLQLSLQYKGEDVETVALALREAGVDAQIQPFFDDMGARLREAHLVITRAGASTVADLLTVGRPAIFVPIPQGGSAGEQLRNAQTIAAAGAGWCMPEAELTPQALASRLQALFDAPIELQAAAASANALGKPDAAQQLADLVERSLHTA